MTDATRSTRNISNADFAEAIRVCEIVDDRLQQHYIDVSYQCLVDVHFKRLHDQALEAIGSAINCNRELLEALNYHAARNVETQ